MKTHTLTALFLGLISCGGTGTPGYGLLMSGDTHGVNPADLDKAWVMATHVMQIDPGEALGAYIGVDLEPATIKYQGRSYAGLTTETVARVVRRACVLAPDSALIHELAHVALYIKTGDSDVGHLNTRWLLVDSISGPCTNP